MSGLSSSSPGVAENSDEEVQVSEEIKEEDVVDLPSDGVSSPKKKRGNAAAAAAPAGSGVDRLNDLLQRTDQFAQFVKRKETAAKPEISKRSHLSVSEAQEDEELIRDEALETAYNSRLLVQPETINGVMKPYQLEALNWLIRLNGQKLNGILADEMVISLFISYFSISLFLFSLKFFHYFLRFRVSVKLSNRSQFSRS